MPSKSFENADKLDSLTISNSAIIFAADISAPSLVISDTFGVGTSTPSAKMHVVGNSKLQGNVTVTGDLSCMGTQTFSNTVFATTSALSVVNVMGTGPALYIGANGTGDIASFYDIDQNVEVLHVGGNNGTFPNVGVKTSTPNKTLTVNGEISASSDIWTGGSFRGAVATFSTSVSAPAVSGTFFGDGSRLTGVKGSGVVVDSTSITSALTSYVFKAADANEVILCNNTNPLTASVPANTFNVGTEIVLIQRGGVVTLSAGPGVTIESNGNKYKTNGTSAGVCLINIQSNVWFLGGSTAI